MKPPTELQLALKRFQTAARAAGVNAEEAYVQNGSATMGNSYLLTGVAGLPQHLGYTRANAIRTIDHYTDALWAASYWQSATAALRQELENQGST